MRRGLFEVLSFDGDPTKEKNITNGEDLKDEGEIRRLTVEWTFRSVHHMKTLSQIDEDILERDKALMFLKGGHPAQQLWVIDKSVSRLGCASPDVFVLGRLPHLVATLKKCEYEPILRSLHDQYKDFDVELKVVHAKELFSVGTGVADHTR